MSLHQPAQWTGWNVFLDQCEYVLMDVFDILCSCSNSSYHMVSAQDLTDPVFVWKLVNIVNMHLPLLIQYLRETGIIWLYITLNLELTSLTIAL